MARNTTVNKTDTARFSNKAGTAAYIAYVPPSAAGRCKGYTEPFSPSDHAIPVPLAIPATHPNNKAHGLNQRENTPTTTEGNNCAIQIPPSNCISIAYVAGSFSTNSSAPNFTTRETTFAIRDSSSGSIFRRTKAPYKFRVNRFEAAIDMIAAGTSAPIATAARQNPANHSGNIFRNSSGTAVFGSFVTTPAASAT